MASSKEWRQFHAKKEHDRQKKIALIEQRKQQRKEDKLKRELKKQSKVERKRKSDDSWYCNICEEEEQDNMIQCIKCHTWYHELCCGDVTLKTKTYICHSCR